MLKRIIALLVVIGGLLLAPLTPAFAGTGWIVVCPYSHSKTDDPIVYPNQPGASHMHDFIGNRTVSASSTTSSMLAGATTCGTAGDRAGYWVPGVYKSGARILPTGNKADGQPVRQVVYYRDDNVSSTYKSTHPTEPFPAGFKMVAGNARAASPAENPKLGKEIYWGCSNNSTGKLSAPANCSTGAISLHVGFPNCWNGKVSGGNEVAAGNVTYPSSGACPSTHPRVLPRVILRYEYPVGTSSSGVTLASGPAYTAHGDFWNTWDQATLTRLVRDCLNANKDCGNNPG